MVRTLGFAEYGDPVGTPIFEFHGNPSSRLGAAFFDEAGPSLGVHVIGVDRPGMGLSDHEPDRKLLDWPDDVLELAAAPNIGRFAVIGGSGGAPSTLACAYKTPERLTSVGVLFGPVWIGILALKPFARELHSDPDGALARLFKNLPEPDVNALRRPDVRKRYLDATREAFRSGTQGAALDFALNMRLWGFRLEDVSTDIHLWYGEDDSVVPLAMGKHLSDALPNCRARVLANEGHFSLLPNHAGEILSALIS